MPEVTVQITPAQTILVDDTHAGWLEDLGDGAVMINLKTALIGVDQEKVVEALEASAAALGR